MIIDAWMQHANAGWIANPMFDSLRRWRPGKWSETAPPIADTLAEMDRADVSIGMLCAWHGPSGQMIGNARSRNTVALIPIASSASHPSISFVPWTRYAS